MRQPMLVTLLRGLFMLALSNLANQLNTPTTKPHSKMLEPVVEWAVSNGPPNWVFIVAILTAPHVWAKQIKQRLTTLLDTYLGQ